MSLLLDTHVVLWWLADTPELPDEIKDRLDHEPDVHVSAATIWEIAIKQALGKITAPADLPERVRDCGFRELPITHAHAMAAGRLPMIHRDPFGRMLIAQARCEGLALVTRDPHCHQYDGQSCQPDTPGQGSLPPHERTSEYVPKPSRSGGRRPGHRRFTRSSTRRLLCRLSYTGGEPGWHRLEPAGRT